MSGNVAATILWLKSRTEEFRERREVERLDAADFAQALRDYMAQTRMLDGLDPPEEAQG